MKTALFIGRFQPFHEGHLDAIKQISEDEIIIGIGSSQYSDTSENPHSFKERKSMIEKSLQNSNTNYKIIAIPDIHDENNWIDHVKNIAGNFDVVYTGNDWVEELFEEKNIQVKKLKININISGTKIRNMKKLVDKINNLKKEKQAVILVHNYQRPEIYQIADFIGDSLELAKRAVETDAKIILFCGVDFMAETAKILNPDKTVLLPTYEARCPMAGMVDTEELKQMQAKYPEAKTVCYVNTTAETKAHCDVCCTSANAVEIVKNLDAKQIIFLPDKNLANYVQSKLPEKQIIPWDGFCYVHSKILIEKLKKGKELHPDAKVVVHPECPMEIIEQADHVTSTSGMITYAKESDAQEFIIATEMGMIERLQIEVPNKKFYSVGSVCIQMKKNTLENVLESLEQEKHVIEVGEDIKIKAKKALDKMIKN
ncbi:MAG: quinolinate synthase NadA [Candidatus Magasanikbacteria bacterium]|jgi:quinolinate synthase|nr:quinolinate synthase NadA [Candidatus Magasanikbacteria bacterium]MBT4314470.1 quinolinate synthase NadA [Candidatus Magasanikbacteria bacterium]MBT4546974.1 quinolinate synthase NadA [Candidatus Magasanikbacteria bacterium]MBT6818907.1 quinolinate synthase NadA [Candidatus Magasanikbacteria bacterium]